MNLVGKQSGSSSGSRVKICILSPHRGDACLSLGLSILRWSRAGHRIQIVNCFTRSTFAPYSDADSVHPNDQMSYVSSLREKEDRTFLRSVPGAEMVDLRLKDAPLRLRHRADKTYDLAMSEADPAIAKIAAALEKRVHVETNGILLVPSNTGSHVDHSTVLEAALQFAAPMPCAFYENLPYALREGRAELREDVIGQIATRIGSQLTPFICRAREPIASGKPALANLYSSQIDSATVAAIVDRAQAYGGELIWTNQRLRELHDAGIPGWSEGDGASRPAC